MGDEPFEVVADYLSDLDTVVDKERCKEDIVVVGNSGIEG